MGPLPLADRVPGRLSYARAKPGLRGYCWRVAAGSSSIVDTRSTGSTSCTPAGRSASEQRSAQPRRIGKPPVRLWSCGCHGSPPSSSPPSASCLAAAAAPPTTTCRSCRRSSRRCARSRRAASRARSRGSSRRARCTTGSAATRSRASSPTADFDAATRAWTVNVWSGPAGEIATGTVDDLTGKVTSAWTGPQVAWTMARGEDGRLRRQADQLAPGLARLLRGLLRRARRPAAPAVPAQPRPARAALVLGLALVLQRRATSSRACR